MSEPAGKIYYTTCPRNCYSTCGLKIEINDGKIKNISANPENLAAKNAPCLKGLSYFERQYSPDRLLYPLKRNGDKFIQIRLDEALTIISEKLNKLKKEFGPKSILYYTGSGSKGLLNGIGEKFWELFGGCTKTYGDLCWPSGLEATRLTLGENKHNDPWDLVNAKLIIIWGKNSSETNIHQTVFINQALDSGAKLIVIDPRRTPTSERAELLIQPRPGTDGALALGIANILIEKKYIDSEFIDTHVLGFSEYKKLTEEYSPEKTSKITDIPVKYIYELAERIGRIKPLTICGGFGMQRYSNSGQTMRSIIALLCITGNIGKSGAGWQFANLQSHIFSKTKDPLAFYPSKEKNGKFRVSVSVAKLGRDIIKQQNPPIKMIWIERGNPVTSNPETGTLLEALKSLEFRVVIDEFLTDTAKTADIILPAKSLFEQSDIITAYWHPYIQWKQKIFDPPGEVKAETEIYRLLAKNLNFPDKEIQDEFPESENEILAYLNKKLSFCSNININELKIRPVLPDNHQPIAFSDYKFSTPSGKIELYSLETNEMWNKNPLPEYEEPVESIKNNGKYPLNLLTPNTKNRIHSQFNNLELISEISSEPVITIHPYDAEQRGINDDNKVKVYNERGTIIIKATVDYSVKRGCVCITNGWWRQNGIYLNELSAARETDMGFGAAFHDCIVEVEKII